MKDATTDGSGEEFVRRKGERKKSTGAPTEPFERPLPTESGSRADVGAGRKRRVLVPIDGSDPSLKAVEHACAAYSNADVTVLHVFKSSSADARQSSTGEGSDDFQESRRAQRRERGRSVERMFDEARGVAAEYDVELVTETATGDATRGIIAYAEERAFDHIVIGSHGRSGFTRVLLGSVAEGVLRRATVPVTVVPTRGEADGRVEVSHVFIPVDASTMATVPLTYTAEMFPRAKCTVAYLIDPAEGYVETEGQSRHRAERWQEKTKRRMERALKDARRVSERGVDCSTTTLLGTPPRAVVLYAEEHDVDHIVVRRRGRTRLARIRPDGVSTSIARRSPVPVTVIN
ncbi:universal stress protein [Haladaptatus salinisoli]|uniref:universal stress protein n=1 Tax=Haladaptatus salinisoli TaxID=2884876 RepID=UPI001D0B62F2|nr:universal stress protein [Haladaptatus salinisoli]